MWLNADMLSPYDFWQFWRNTTDADTGRFLKLYTEMPLAEIAKLGALGGSEINEAKKILATEATAMLHGRAVAEEAAETARRTFEEGQSAAGLPSIELDLDKGTGLLAACVAAGFASSNGEARRLVQQGAVRINNAAVGDPARVVTPADLAGETIVVLRAGRRRQFLARFV